MVISPNLSGVKWVNAHAEEIIQTAGAVAHSLTSHPRLNNTPGEAGETFECRKRCNGQLH